MSLHAYRETVPAVLNKRPSTSHPDNIGKDYTTKVRESKTCSGPVGVHGLKQQIRGRQGFSTGQSLRRLDELLSKRDSRPTRILLPLDIHSIQTRWLVSQRPGKGCVCCDFSLTSPLHCRARCVETSVATNNQTRNNKIALSFAGRSSTHHNLDLPFHLLSSR